MLQYVALGLIAIAILACPYWAKGKRVFLPAYLWAVYAAVAPIQILGIQPLQYRWELSILSGFVGLYWWWKAPRKVLDPFVWLPAVLMGLCFASISHSRTPDYSLYRALALIPVYSFFFLGGRSLLETPGGFKAMVVSCATYLTIALALVLASPADAGMPTINTDDSGRFMGHLKATGTAQVIVSSMPMIFWYMRHNKRVPAMAYIALLGLMSFLLLATRTRGALLSFALFMPSAWSAIMSKSKTVQAALASLLFVVLALLALQALPKEKVQTALRAHSGKELIATRLEDRWDLLWYQSLERPLLGHGIGTARFYLSKDPKFDLANPDLSRWQEQSASHNEFLTHFYELGVAGPISLLALYLAVIRSGLGLLRTRPTAERSILLAVFFSTCTDMIDTLLHDGYITVGNPYAVFFWWKCMILVVWSKKTATAASA